MAKLALGWTAQMFEDAELVMKIRAAKQMGHQCPTLPNHSQALQPAKSEPAKPAAYWAALLDVRHHALCLLVCIGVACLVHSALARAPWLIAAGYHVKGLCGTYWKYVLSRHDIAPANAS